MWESNREAALFFCVLFPSKLYNSKMPPLKYAQRVGHRFTRRNQGSYTIVINSFSRLVSHDSVSSLKIKKKKNG